jgi:hypothetical protein
MTLSKQVSRQALGSYLGLAINSIDRSVCTGCNTVCAKIQRIEGRDRFCIKCYHRFFKKIPCVECSTVARIYTPLTHGRCRPCVMGPRICHRCDKGFVRAGKVVDNKWVCNPCARYFCPPKTCEECGTSSIYVARDQSSGRSGLLCLACRNDNHRSCAHCRRDRPVAKLVAGKAYCKPCTLQPDINHFCPQCFVRVPGNGNGKCSACIFQNRLNSRLELLVNSFSTPHYAEFFREFANWRMQTVGAEVAIRTIVKETNVLATFESAGVVLGSNLTSTELLRLATPAQWRSMTNLQAYLAVRFNVLMDAHAKRDSSELERIFKLMANAHERGFGPLLTKYRAHLEDPNQSKQLKLLTLRQYLSAASKFLRLALVTEESSLKNNPKIDWIVRQNPAIYTSLVRFKSFCRKNLGVDFTFSPPADRKSSTSRSLKLKRDLALAFEVLSSHDASRATIVAAIVFALKKTYGIAEKDVLALRVKDLRITSNSAIVYLPDSAPIEMDLRIARAMSTIASPEPEALLFRGRVPGAALVVAPAFPPKP